MAIIKRGNSYQAKLKGSDGYWVTGTFATKRDADGFEMKIKSEKRSGAYVSNRIRHLTLTEYFSKWHAETQGTRASEGWRGSQLQMFDTYVRPHIGEVRLQAVTPVLIAKVLQKINKLGRAKQTQLHVFSLLHKLFRDAIELHEFLDRSPVKRSMKPSLDEREANFLEVEDARRLLSHVQGQTYEAAVWLGIFVGMRVGEIQALTWSNVDLERRLIHIRRTYVRREKRFKETPKGRRDHTVPIPPELLEILLREKRRAVSEYVVTSPRRPFLSYDGYLKALKRYCKDAGLKDVATHALRHSASPLWMEHGASEECMRSLFHHSSSRVTERYIHFKPARRLGKVADIIRLFPIPEMADDNSTPSQKLPIPTVETLGGGKGVC